MFQTDNIDIASLPSEYLSWYISPLEQESGRWVQCLVDDSVR